MLCFHHQRISLRAVSRRPGQGAGLLARLDFAGQSRLHEPALRSAGASCCHPASEGSVSTLPGSFKGFALTPDQVRLVRDNLFQCVEYIDKLSRRTGRKLHLGLEPEPLGLLETTAETVEFFRQIRAEHPKDERLDSLLGVNYDTCHLAIEYEHPAASLAQLRQAGIKISKLHLSFRVETTAD